MAHQKKGRTGKRRSCRRGSAVHPETLEFFKGRKRQQGKAQKAARLELEEKLAEVVARPKGADVDSDDDDPLLADGEEREVEEDGDDEEDDENGKGGGDQKNDAATAARKAQLERRKQTSEKPLVLNKEMLLSLSTKQLLEVMEHVYERKDPLLQRATEEYDEFLAIADLEDDGSDYGDGSGSDYSDTVVHNPKSERRQNKDAISYIDKFRELLGLHENWHVSRKLACVILVALRRASPEDESRVTSYGQPAIAAVRAFLESMDAGKRAQVLVLAELARTRADGLGVAEALALMKPVDETTSIAFLVFKASLRVTYYAMLSIVIELLYAYASMTYKKIDKRAFSQWMTQGCSGQLPAHVFTKTEPDTAAAAGTGQRQGQRCYGCQGKGHIRKDCPHA